MSLSPLLKQIYIIKYNQIENEVNISMNIQKYIKDIYLTTNKIISDIQNSFKDTENLKFFEDFVKIKQIFDDISNIEDIDEIKKNIESQNKLILLIFLIENITKKIIGLQKISKLNNEIKSSSISPDAMNEYLSDIEIEDLARLEIVLVNQESILKRLFRILDIYIDILEDPLNNCDESKFIDSNSDYIKLLKDIYKQFKNNNITEL